MLVELVLWIFIFATVNIFSIINFLGLDYLEKQRKLNLIKLNKLKFLFTRFKKNSDLKNFIGKKTLIWQIIHIIITSIMFVIVILDILLIKNGLIRYLSMILFAIYFVINLALIITISIASQKYYKK